jgi:hypothetical protein
MKKILTLLCLLSMAADASAQSYNSPESVEFDYANNRWFIANHTGHTIITRSSATGALGTFVSTGLTSGPHGLEIVNDTLYACDGTRIRAYNVSTGANIFSKVITGSSFLNGITHDAAGNLYITDYSGNKIYKFRTASRTFTTFVGSGLSSPNGIIYDGANNRCVFVQWTGAFRAVSLADSSVTTLLTSGLSSCDGITMDAAGNWFISSWGGNKITRYNSTFGSPTIVVTGLSSPADIFYNVLTDTLGNPNSGTLNNTTYHYFGSATGVSESATNNNFNVSPNPIEKTAEVNYDLSANGRVSIKLFDIGGSLIKTILEENQQKGKQTAFFNRNGIAAGTYFIVIHTDQGTQSKKIILSK